MIKYTYLFVLLIACQQVLAQQEAEAPPPDVYTMSLEDLMNVSVVTASQSKQSASDAPATIYVITREQIYDRGYNSLEELLEDIPEIEIQRKSVAEHSNHISLRGISGNEKFMILLNGIRVNSMAGTPHAVTNNYSLANASKVEIVLGPASALYGADAFSGIINIITRTGEEIKGAEASAQVGSYGTSNISLVGGQAKGNVSFNVTASIYSSAEPEFPKYYKDDFRWYNDTYKENGDLKQLPFNNVVNVGAPKAYETPTNAYFINAALKMGEFEFGYFRNYESHNSSMGMRPEYNIYTKDAQYNSIIQNFYLIHNFNSEDQRLNIQSNIYQDNYELDPNSLFQNTFTGFSKGYKYAFDNSFFIREQISYKINEMHSIVGGVSYQNINALAKTGDLPFKFDKDVPASLQSQYYLGTNTADQNGNDLTIYQDFYYVEQKNIGGFVQLQSSLASMLQLTAGLRYDYNTRYGGATNPRVGLVVTPVEKFKVKLLYGESFLAPSIYKAFQHYGAFIPVDGNGDFSPAPATTVELFGPFWHLTNPDLKPEKLKTAELGISYIASSFGLSADAYYNKITNLIVAEPDASGVTFQGVNMGDVERPINHGEATTYGFTVKLDSYHELGKLKLQGYVAYSYSDGDIDSNPLPYSAKNTVKAGVMMKYGKFSLNPRVIYRSATTHSTEKDANGDYQTNDSYMVLNLFARFSFNKVVAMYFKASNLLDKRYYNVSLGQGESFYATPQDPIRLNIGVNVKLGGPK